jgi:hypothetical protein
MSQMALLNLLASYLDALMVLASVLALVLTLVLLTLQPRDCVHALLRKKEAEDLDSSKPGHSVDSGGGIKLWSGGGIVVSRR